MPAGWRIVGRASATDAVRDSASRALRDGTRRQGISGRRDGCPLFFFFFFLQASGGWIGRHVTAPVLTGRGCPRLERRMGGRHVPAPRRESLSMLLSSPRARTRWPHPLPEAVCGPSEAGGGQVAGGRRSTAAASSCGRGSGGSKTRLGRRHRRVWPALSVLRTIWEAVGDGRWRCVARRRNRGQATGVARRCGACGTATRGEKVREVSRPGGTSSYPPRHRCSSAVAQAWLLRRDPLARPPGRSLAQQPPW